MKSTLTLIRADLAVNRGDARSQYVMTLFRVATALTTRGRAVRIASTPLRMLYRLTAIWILSVELPIGTRVGPGLRLLHAFGIVVHERTVIGADCGLKHGCTLGVRTGLGPGNAPPTLGDGVQLGPGAQILGPVTIGDRAQIGAGAIVMIDVPAGGVAVGNPARLVAPRERQAA